MSACITICDAVISVSDWLHRWQTLVGAGVAFFGAWLTVGKIREQIVVSRDQRQDEIARRHRAARVTLPVTLAAVSDVTNEIANNACQVREMFLPEGTGQTLEAILDQASIPKRFETVTLPPQALTSFENFVETLNNPSEIKHVHELMASLQVLLSWYNSFDLKAAGVASSLERLLLRAARVKLLTDVMFSYGREPDAKDFSLMANSRAAIWDEIHKSAQSLVFSRPSPDLYFSGFSETIERCKRDEQSPWVEGGAL